MFYSPFGVKDNLQRQSSDGWSNRMKVKVSFKDDTRVWRYGDHYDLKGLRKFVEDTWDVREFSLKYDDMSIENVATDVVDKITIGDKQDLSDMFVFARNAQRTAVKIYAKEPDVDPNANVGALQRQLVVLRQRVNALESRMNAEEKSFLDSQETDDAEDNKKVANQQKVHFVYPYPGIIQPFFFEMAMDRLITGYIHIEMLCVPKDQFFIYPSLASFSAIIMRYTGNVVQDEPSKKEIEELTTSNKTLTVKLGIADFQASQREVVLKPEDYGHWSDDDDRYLGRNDDDGYWS